MNFTHDDIEERVLAYLYGELDTDARAAFEGHLAACTACGEHVGALRETRAAARATTRAALDEPMPAAVRGRVMSAALTAARAQVAAAGSVSEQSLSTRWSAWLRGRWTLPTFATVAALGVLLLGREVIFREAHRPLDDTPPAATSAEGTPEPSLAEDHRVGKPGLPPDPQVRDDQKEEAAPAGALGAPRGRPVEKEGPARATRPHDSGGLTEKQTARKAQPSAPASADDARANGAQNHGRRDEEAQAAAQSSRAPFARPSTGDPTVPPPPSPAKRSVADFSGEGLDSEPATLGLDGEPPPRQFTGAPTPAHAPAAPAPAPMAAVPGAHSGLDHLAKSPHAAAPPAAATAMEEAEHPANRAPAPSAAAGVRAGAAAGAGAAAARAPSFAQPPPPAGGSGSRDTGSAAADASSSRDRAQASATAGSDDPRVISERADKLMHAAQWAQAIGAYRELLRRFPGHPLAPTWRRQLVSAQAAAGGPPPPTPTATPLPASP